MKNGLKLHEWQKGQKTSVKEEETWVVSRDCMICSKTGLKGAYGHWGDGWTCSAACERIQAAKPKYPGHTEEDFFNRQGESDGLLDMQQAVPPPVGA